MKSFNFVGLRSLVYWSGGSICEIEDVPRTLEFVDEFNGTTLDTDVWVTHFPSLKGVALDQEVQKAPTSEKLSQYIPTQPWKDCM